MTTTPLVTKPRLRGLLALTLVLAACASNLSNQQGMDLINQGRLAEALPVLEKATREDPENRELRIRFLNAREQLVGQLLADAQREKSLGNFAESEILYLSVLNSDRDNARAHAGLAELKRGMNQAQLLREARALMADEQLDLAEQKLNRVLQDQPQHPEAMALRRQIDEKSGRNRLVVPGLRKSFLQPVTLEFVDAGFKQVLEALSRYSGLNFILDKDVPPGITITVFLKQVTVEEALDVVLTTQQLRKRVLTDNTVLIYPDTVAKQSDNQDLVVKSYFLANADAKQVMAMLKTLLKVKSIVTEDKLNLVILRDTPAMVELADRLVATHDVPEPEVMLEVEIVEIQRSQLLDLGIDFPDKLVLTPLPIIGNTLENLKNLSSSTVGAVLPATTINMTHQLGDTNLLANPRIRTHNREKALIRIGDRLPVITNTSTSTGFVAENVQYIDVGLKLEVEPTIYSNDEISIKLALEVSSVIKEIVSDSGTTTYQIGTRNAATVLRLKDGENQVLGGLINDQDVQSANRFPGLGDLPILGRLFSSQKNSRDKTELVLSITPRLVRGMSLPVQVPSTYWSGTENDPRLTPMTLTQSVPTRAAGVPLLQWKGPDQVRVGEPFKLTLELKSPSEEARLPVQIGIDPAIFETLEGGAGTVGQGSPVEIVLRARKPIKNSLVTAQPSHALKADQDALGDRGLAVISLSVMP